MWIWLGYAESFSSIATIAFVGTQLVQLFLFFSGFPIEDLVAILADVLYRVSTMKGLHAYSYSIW